MSKALLMTLMCTVMWVAQAAAQTQTSPRLALELTDGAQLLGPAAVESVKIQAPDSAIQLPLRDIAHIQFHPDHEHVTVHLKEGYEECAAHSSLHNVVEGGDPGGNAR